MQVEIEDPGGTDGYGKQRKCYVAAVKGLDPTYRFERSFLRSAIVGTTAVIPSKVGVYEVQDWPAGERQRRYYVVGEDVALELDDPDEVEECLTNEDVDGWLLTRIDARSTREPEPAESLLATLYHVRDVVGDPTSDQEDVLAALELAIERAGGKETE